MISLDVSKYKFRIDNLFNKCERMDDLELSAHCARYLCILVSGFLDTSIQTIYSKYAEDCSNPKISSFVSKQLGRLTNLNMKKIEDLAKSFSDSWAKELTDFDQENNGQIKASVDSVVANRNSIAHGRDVGITHVTLKGYYKNIFKLVSFIEKQCKGELRKE